MNFKILELGQTDLLRSKLKDFFNMSHPFALLTDLIDREASSATTPTIFL